MIAFGPVPSRRLGMSLGINMIPPKTCTYSCVYCQLGRTSRMTVERMRFYDAGEVLSDVSVKVGQAAARGVDVDWLSFVPDGEPTLERDLEKQIRGVKRLGALYDGFEPRTAVITNSSLLWNEEVREGLLQADLVSVKIDAVSEDLWKRIDRPQGSLRLGTVLRGIANFASEFKGTLWTETMLVAGINDTPESLIAVADFIESLKAAKCFLSVPVRPPAEPWVRPASEYGIGLGYHILRDRKLPTELLIGYEGSEFARTGDVEEDLLSITSVHPMREDAVEEFLKESGESFTLIDRLLAEGALVENVYGGNRFYMRSLEKAK
ncbi:MAG: radical SAM protein [Spirochaetes bacterium]|nr:radical SAM protein [Spirochaetota bacterium]